MSINQVKNLHSSTVSYVSEKLFTNLNHHLEDNNCPSCNLPWNVEMCSVLKETREQFRSLPVPIIESIFSMISFNVYERNIRISAKYLFAYSYILEFRDVNINFSFFLEKYKNYVQTLSCASPVIQHYRGASPRTAINISVMNLQYVLVDDVLLEAVGRYCEQIRRIQGICIDENVTATSFKKLCFRNYDTSGESFKNACCESLEYFVVEYSEFDVMDEQMLADKNRKDDILFVLLNNLSNLKSFGDDFKVDCYLNSRPISVETNLGDITLNKLSDESITLVKQYCPKITTLRCSVHDETLLSSYPESFLPYLKEIQMFLSLDSEIIMYKILTMPMWSIVRRLSLGILHYTSEINLSILAKYFSVLESLSVLYGNVSWDGKYTFNCLREGTFNISHYGPTETEPWLLAFSGTMKYLDIGCPLHSQFNENVLKSLLIRSFSKLETLQLRDFEYDFNFITNVISTIPSLRRLKLSTSITTEQHNDVQQFLKENNYSCMIKVRIL